MNIWQLFTRRADGRAEPFDPEAYTAQLEANLASRREKRPANREAARKGWQTRRTV